LTDEQGRLSRDELLYEKVIARHLDEGFVERFWLATRIERHFRDPDCRFVLVSGGPGAGKSTLLAWLTQRHALSPRYFLRRLSSHPLAGGDAWSLLLSVGHQLALLRPELMRIDLDVQVTQAVGRVAEAGRVVGARVGLLHISPFQHTAVQVTQQVDVAEGSVVGFEIARMVADSRLNDVGNLQHLALIEPAVRLAAADPAAMVVLCIDSVDELRHQGRDVGRKDILEWLADCPELPPNLRVVVSARPDAELLRRFRLAQKDRLREERIEPSAAEVREDLLKYARRVVTAPEVAGQPEVRRVGAEAVARRIVDRAEGSFLYLNLWASGLLDAVAGDDAGRVAALTELAVLPAGLDGIYEYFLVLIRDTVKRREGAQWTHHWKRVHLRLLEVLAVVQAPLPRKTLLLLTELTADRAGAREALDDLAQFLSGDARALRFHHVTMAEFLTSADEDRILDDWHVEADESHLAVAQRLLAEHGDSWEICDDAYALNHTASHLVASIRTAGSAATRGEATRLLTGLLAVPAFGIAKSSRIGVDDMLADYVAAYATLPGSAELADGLIAVLVRLINEGRTDLAISLHAMVQYRLEVAELNAAVLRRLSDPDHLAEVVQDPRHRASALISFSHGEAARLRRLGGTENLDAAHRLLTRAVAEVGDIDQATSARQRSSLFYDLAYLEVLHGRLDQALAWFTEAAEAADEADDRTAAFTSRLVGLRHGMLGGLVTPEEFKAGHFAALEYFTSDEGQGPDATRWVMNVHAHLADLGLLTGDLDLVVTHVQELEDDPWIRSNDRADILLRFRARAAWAAGHWAVAAELFAGMLADDLTDPPSHREELSRELYYYGQAMAGLGDHEKARELWELGLRCPDNAGNWPWKPKLTEALLSSARP
jgi:tetratricopeptide (TPR) repeat protein